MSHSFQTRAGRIFPFLAWMKSISLTQGRFALVDDCDFEWLLQWKWSAVKNPHKCGDLWYAKRNGGPRARSAVYMHREIAARVGIPDVDHWDGDGLHNWRANLRPCTRSQNLGNQRKRAGCTSQFKGVSWRAQNSKWLARACVNGERIYLGYFQDEVEAAKAYDATVVRQWGKFAKLNFPVAA